MVAPALVGLQNPEGFTFQLTATAAAADTRTTKRIGTARSKRTELNTYGDTTGHAMICSDNQMANRHDKKRHDMT